MPQGPAIHRRCGLALSVQVAEVCNYRSAGQGGEGGNCRCGDGTKAFGIHLVNERLILAQANASAELFRRFDLKP